MYSSSTQLDVHELTTSAFFYSWLVGPIKLWNREQLAHETGFTTTKGAKLEVVSYGNPVRDAKPAARVCKVITRSFVDAVQKALVDRGLPVEVILRITQPGSGDLCRSNVVLVHLHPSFPVSRIPWKLPLMERGFGLAPRRLSVQGACCVVCRSSDHRQHQCEFYRDSQCGRCGFPLEKLAEAGVDTHLHDCEGGPTGLGVEHLDLLGSAWIKSSWPPDRS